MINDADRDLSLGAELLLLALDPATARPLSLPRRRFRKALGLAQLANTGGQRVFPWTVLQARRRAIRDLLRAGLVGGRSLRSLQLLDRPFAAARWQRVQRCIRDNELSAQRDSELLLVLAIAGVLKERLPRDQMKLAARRLRGVVSRGESGLAEAPLSGSQPLNESWVVLAAGAAIGTWDMVGAGGSDGGFGGVDVDGGSQ